MPLAIALTTLAPLGPLGCSSSSSGLACGGGTVQKGNECVAGGADASLDAAPAEAGVSIAPDGAAIGIATVSPTFAGIAAVAPVSDSALLIVWNAGTEPGDPSAPLRYRVYEATSPTPLSYMTPTVQTGVGARSVVIGGLAAGTTYVFGARAVNVADRDDGNTVQMKGTPSVDTTAPTFGGVTTAAPGTGGTVALSWTAATDSLTPAPAMTYLVYMSETAGGEDFDTPTLTTAPGDTSASVTRLTNATKPRFFVVRARDAAGNIDTNTKELSAEPAPDVTAPEFGGCTAATTLQAITIGVTWNAASDDVSVPENLAYDVFESTKPGVFDFTKPFATVTGADTVSLPSLATATTYYFVCRARDEAGNEDDNTVEVSATTGSNPVPPTFGGIQTFSGDPAARTATIGWAAAADVATPTNQILYDVYESQTPGGEDFTKPPAATSTAGALTITLTGIAPNTTTYFVVRARDLDGNRDSNVVEQSLTTNVSFSLNVQPIFSDDCGVVGCHVPGSPTGGLILAQGFAYAQIVGVTAGEGAPLSYVTPTSPTSSFLAVKINYMNLFTDAAPGTYKGTQMPASATGSTLSPAEINAIGNWILQGAVNN
jgi:hypothetical protein